MRQQRATDGPIDVSSNSPLGPTRPLPGGAIAKAHADFVMALAARKPCPFTLEPAPEDFTARAVLCEELIDRVRTHLSALVEEAAENDAAQLIREARLTQSIDAYLGDLAGDITGTLEHVAERLREERYDGCPRGPFYRRR
ncbi:MAG TPA: hypothetical protein VKW08_14495 [Xanthobacteraceae bacterium]|nr:hypothetical protein [Xanthobacteraceae bacterium]